MPSAAATPWALILAGGDGLRLRGLTRRHSGDSRPKQYCALRLAALPVKDVEWTDRGHPARVMATWQRTGARPDWLTDVELEPAV